MADAATVKDLAYDPADLWVLDHEDLRALEIGAGILGTGGGGNPYIGRLRAEQAMRDGFKLTILPHQKISDDALCVSLGGIGAPVVGVERIREGREGLRCVRVLEEHLGVRVDAVACEEIGGSNSMEPLMVGAFAGLPVIDCDGMGRAFPEMQMTTYSIYGHRSTPSAMCDVHGNAVLFQHAASEIWHERMARATVVSQGGASTLASAPMRGAFVKQFGIPDSYTQAINLGRAVMRAQKAHDDPIAEICRVEKGRMLFTGKISDLKRHLKGGFVRGEVQLSGIDRHVGESGSVLIQNENLVFFHDGQMECCVPDLILVLDVDTGEAITTEMLRYGQRVAIVALPCHDLLRSPQALEVVGPAAFGLDVTYTPLEGV
ncbi:MAG: hydantoinase [Rhodobacteraceae bacterium]|nr:hydantoinase [Paracoccaceae bacterium]